MTTVAYDPFDACADVYDTFTSHHDYDQWIGAIEPLARRHGLRERGRLLDVGTGTGKSLEPWLERGWSAVGCDRSHAMIVEAQAKLGDRVELVTTDARTLPALGSFDFVQVLGDVVNYLTAEDLVPLFEGVARNLEPDGVCVFDLTTRMLMGEFFSSTDIRETDDEMIVWRGRSMTEVAPGGTVEADLYVFVRSPTGWERHHGRHCQHHHPVEIVEQALVDAGLRLEAAYGQDASARMHEHVDELRHRKIVLVARHDASGAG